MIRRVTSLLAVFALWGCGATEPQVSETGVRAPEPMIAAAPSPEPPVEGGIGGTGIVVAGEEGGIGGTGSPRLAGAVGTVTGFGSIRINGLRVVFPASGRVMSPTGSVSEADVDLGETLEILGVSQPDGTVRPTDAMFRFPVVGQVDRVDLTGTELSIMGARVVLERGALVVDENGLPVQIRAGDFVQVSGLPRGDVVIASRVERLIGPVRNSVMGRVEASDVFGAVRINGVLVNYGSSLPPRVGWTVRVSGAMSGGQLVPYETVRSLMETVTSPVPDVSVEGYLEPRAAPAGVGIGGFGREFDAGSKVTSLTGERALFIGALTDGTFQARHGLRLPNEAVGRQMLLESVENGFAPAGAIETR